MAEIAARTLALPDAQSVEDLTALLTSAGSAEVASGAPPPTLQPGMIPVEFAREVIAAHVAEELKGKLLTIEERCRDSAD